MPNRVNYGWKELRIALGILIVFNGGGVAIRLLIPKMPPGAQGALYGLMIAGSVSILTRIIKKERDLVIAATQGASDRVIREIERARDRIITESRSGLWRIAEGITDRHLRSVTDFF